MLNLPIEIQDWLIAGTTNGAVGIYLIGVPLSYLGYLGLTYRCIVVGGDSWWTLFWAALTGIELALFWPLIGLFFLVTWVWGRIEARLEDHGSPIEKNVFSLIKKVFWAIFTLSALAAIWPIVLAGVLIIVLVLLLGEKDGRCEISGAYMYRPMTWREYVQFKFTGKGRERANLE